MLFITESDLRDQFKLQAITNFKLPPDTKLTPGARQFLLCATNFIGGDIGIIQDISKVGRFVLGILKYIECGIMTENLEYKVCEHINEVNFDEELSDCFEINDFYVQVENGKDIITLYRLKMLYRNFYEELEDYQFESEEVKTNVKKYMCQVINTLSRLICTIHGSKKCQKL